MPTPTHCPGCKKPVPKDAEVCPFCPVSFREEDIEDEEKPRHDALTPQAKLAIIAAAAVAVGLGTWRGLEFLLTHADTNPKDAVMTVLPPARVDRDQTPLPVSAKNTQPPGSQASPNDKEEEEEEQGPGTMTIMASEAPSPSEKPATEWKLRGVVYDLVTLKPVPRAKMTFSDVSTNARFETVADDDGRYRVIVPPIPGRGYTVAISKEGYSPSYLNPGTEGVKEKGADERKELAHELSTALNPPYTLEAYGSAPLVTDIYLAPESAK